MVSVVSFHPKTQEFVAEKAPEDSVESELSIEALRRRIRQQDLLANFGVLALKGTPFTELLDNAALLVADGLHARTDGFTPCARCSPDA